MRALQLGLLVLVAGCGESPTEPTDPRLFFSTRIIPGIATLATSVEVYEWGVDVSGIFPTNLGYKLTALLTAPSATELILEVSAVKDHEAPAIRVQNYYLGRILYLRRGEYDLQVFEALKDSLLGQRELAFQGKFRVD
ncbi:MAG: hypothetical protein ACT4PM_10285 [Gemmatimonadales bacterium]